MEAKITTFEESKAMEHDRTINEAPYDAAKKLLKNNRHDNKPFAVREHEKTIAAFL